ncbi:hypothetical protein SEVIR_7G316100v4 [Setaria viridis]|uniref:DUF7866 domain-containing protein n=2 Tax=Setaria TaxID=4554 RepID=K3YAN9_SETIT|nr:uncharacterized protein LOC101782635 isoform X2 [Setaria italica]XP_034604971.1 uncharacterized protein LOC117865008 isoform X2 [Setaria viridis]RCV36270.1 hypothetical protein SETIT_7G305200v2 [Setaria italica]TKW07575.1 hypothetical protein SEVIR_7G316100v2 [Setaria viridis]
MAHHLRVSMISLTGFTVLSLALLFTSLQAQGASNLGSGKVKRQSSPEEYVPVRSVVYWSRSSVALPAAATAEAVGYEPFAVCEGCRCCLPSNASSCVDTSCCYSIDCNLPGKPFGTCAFTPQTCGCAGTNNCTQPS